MKKIISSIVVVLVLFLFVSYPVSAVLPNGNPVHPEIDVGGGGGKSIVTILIETLFGGKGVKVDVPNIDIGTSPTPDPNVTPGVTPDITNPPINTDEATYADKVVAAAKTYCGGVIYSGNASTCVPPFASIPMNSEARNILIESANTFTYAQCVAGARSMTYARGKAFTKYAGSALGFCNITQPGYQMYPAGSDPTTIKPGSLFIQDVNGSVWGHIGFVTKVNGAKRSVIVFEVNWGLGTVKHGREIPIAYLKCWQTPI